MAKLSIVKGATSVLVRVFIQDSSSTVGAGLSGLTNASSGLICYRARDDDGNAGGTQISLQSATLGTWTSAGFKEKDATNMKGVYEFGIPNNALATGSRSVTIMFSGATNMAPCLLEIELTGWDNQDAVHGGMSALPNTACTTNASLITSGTSTDQLSVTSGIAQANVEQWDSVAIAEPTTDGVPDVNVLNWHGGAVPAPNVTGVPLVDLKYTLGTISPAAAGSVSVDWAQVVNKTSTVALTGTTISTTQTITSVSGSVGSVTGAVGSVTAAVTLSAGDSPVLQSGTAAAGGATSITLASAIGADSRPVGCTVKITSGTGAGQARVITAYVDATKVCTVDRAWATNPDTSSVYSVLYTDLPALSSGLKVSEVSLVDTLTTYTGDTPQTGDCFARLGAPAGASIAADIAEVEAETDGIASIPTNPLLTTDARLNHLDADISSRSAPGTAQTVDGTSALTESYATGAFTLAQALYEIAQVVGQFSIAGTTLTFQKRDGTTTGGTFTLNDATTPTSRTRAS